MCCIYAKAKLFADCKSAYDLYKSALSNEDVSIPDFSELDTYPSSDDMPGRQTLMRSKSRTKPHHNTFEIQYLGKCPVSLDIGSLATG